MEQGVWEPVSNGFIRLGGNKLEKARVRGVFCKDQRKDMLVERQ